MFTVEPELATPYVQKFNLNVQRQLGAAGGAAGRLRRLVGPRASSATATSTSSTRRPARRPFPDFFYINQFEIDGDARATTRCRRACTARGWHGLTSTLNYTWSHSIDNASDGQDYVPNASQPDDSTRSRDARSASSNFDVRHRLTWYFTYDMPGSASGARACSAAGR